mmetsp:Transcript_35914/g.43369  ORF Transcript_35914/g.43369 Transcript_35914/m.43369 type:complete len:88 (+) Transcript_35914:361-624(+)
MRTVDGPTQRADGAESVGILVQTGRKEGQCVHPANQLPKHRVYVMCKVFVRVAATCAKCNSRTGQKQEQALVRYNMTTARFEHMQGE